MKAQKIKRYRLSVSRTFPTTHPRKGESTYFIPKIESALGILNGCNPSECLPFILDCTGCYYMLPESEIFPKLHTCRGNYERWAKIMAEVQAGKAVIDLFYWDGKPYGKGVKQVVFATLDKNSGCGVQKLEFSASGLIGMIKIDDDFPDDPNEVYCINELAKNDGLLLEDFKAWFKGYDLSQPMAIVHFTPFRY